MIETRNDANGASAIPAVNADDLQTPPSPSNASLDNVHKSTVTTTKQPLWRRAVDIITWVPPRCRWDPDTPPKFSMPLNILFAFAGAFTVANLYYNHPILNILAEDFNVPYVQVSEIPTLAQAGYAVGLLFLCPLGDLFKRRTFVLSLVFCTATIWIGMCVTKSLAVFSAIQFLTAVTTVTPQLMLPLVGDLAPPHRRAAALSIVASGLMLGVLIARLLSGILTQYTTWRAVYWLAMGLQYAIFAALWCFMPDYPSTNPGGLNYFKMLWSILVMLTKHPVLVQACFISFFTSATFTCFWTTLTFLLAGPPYHYDPTIIGLFALIGIASMILGPFYARYLIDRFVPMFSVILGMGWSLLGITIGTYTGSFTVAGPVIQAFFNDFGMQTAQTANRSSIYSIEPKARNRVNTAFMLATFCGQLVGTTVGNHLYARGGWIASGSYSVGSIGMALLFCVIRGPWEEGWVGWTGGWSIIKKDRNSGDGKKAEQASHLHGKVKEDVTDLEKGPHEQADASNMDFEKSLEMMAAEDGENLVREKNEELDVSRSDKSRKEHEIIAQPVMTAR